MSRPPSFDAAGLRAYAEALPPGTAVPVVREWLLALLAATDTPAATMADPDLTVHDLAERFGRRPSTIRTWVEAGRFPGAYRFQNREWRVPAAGVAAFEAGARDRPRPRRDGMTVAPPRADRTVVDLGTWRDAG